MISGSLESDATNSLASHSSSLHSAAAAFASAELAVAHHPLPFVSQLAKRHQASGKRQRLVHALFSLPGSDPALPIGIYMSRFLINKV